MSTSSQSTPALAQTVFSVDHTRSSAQFRHFLDFGSVQSVLHASTILPSSCKAPWQSPSVKSPCHIIPNVLPISNTNRRNSATAYFSRQHNCHRIASLHVGCIQDRPLRKIILRRQKGEINLNHWLSIGMTLSSLRLDTVLAPVPIGWNLQHFWLQGILVNCLLLGILVSSRPIKRNKQCISNPLVTSRTSGVLTFLDSTIRHLDVSPFILMASVNL